MFPAKLSNGLISLVPGQKRLAITMWLKFPKSHHKSPEFHVSFEKTILINNYKTDYDTFETNSKHQKFMEFIKNIPYQGFSTCNLEFDSHKMIEKMMVMYNCEVAKYLIQHNQQPILRVHKKSSSLLSTETMTTELSTFLRIIKSNSASYYLPNDDLIPSHNSYKNDNNNFHSALNIHNYIHFTSPIRRYVDCFNHCLIHKILNNEHDKTVKYGIDINYINEKNRLVKKAEREFSKLKLEKYIMDTGIHEFSGYVYEFDAEKYKVSIYLPKFKISFKMPLYSKALENHFQIKLNEQQQQIIVTNCSTNKIEKKICYCKLIPIQIALQFQKNRPYSKLQIQI